MRKWKKRIKKVLNEAWRINSFDSTRGTIVDDFSKIEDNMSLL